MQHIASDVLEVLRHMGAQGPILSGKTMDDLNLAPDSVEQEINLHILNPNHKKPLHGEVTGATTVQALVLLVMNRF